MTDVNNIVKIDPRMIEIRRLNRKQDLLDRALAQHQETVEMYGDDNLMDTPFDLKVLNRKINTLTNDVMCISKGLGIIRGFDIEFA